VTAITGSGAADVRVVAGLAVNQRRDSKELRGSLRSDEPSHGHNALHPAACPKFLGLRVARNCNQPHDRLQIVNKGMGARMRSSNNRSTGATQLSAAIHFHTQPGMGWRLHISKLAAEVPVAAPGAGSRRLRKGEKARTD
jgi:hypothetical protein